MYSLHSRILSFRLFKAELTKQNIDIFSNLDHFIQIYNVNRGLTSFSLPYPGDFIIWSAGNFEKFILFCNISFLILVQNSLSLSANLRFPGSKFQNLTGWHTLEDLNILASKRMYSNILSGTKQDSAKMERRRWEPPGGRRPRMVYDMQQGIPHHQGNKTTKFTIQAVA